MSITRLDVLMKKVDDMQTALGVKPTPKRLDESERALLGARNKLKELEDKIDERAHKISIYGDESKERIEVDIAIRQLMNESEQAIKDYDNSLAPMRKKFNTLSDVERAQFTQKEKLVDLLKEQYNASKQNYEGGDHVALRRKGDPNSGLLSGKRVLMSERATSRELTTEEQEALQRFKQNDEKIDDMLVLVIQDIELLKEKATKIDEAIDRNKEKLQRVDKHADKTGAKLETINVKLKEIIKKYAAPSRMCLYIVMLIVVLGLLMILYNQIK